MAAIMRKPIFPSKNYRQPLPYSPGILVNNTLYIAGQVGLDQSGKLVPGGVVQQTKQVLDNIGNILEEAGASFSNVVKATVLLADIKDSPVVNEIYAQYFTQPYPARATYQVAALPLGASIEIEAIAVVGTI